MSLAQVHLLCDFCQTRVKYLRYNLEDIYMCWKKNAIISYYVYVYVNKLFFIISCKTLCSISSRKLTD